MEKEKPIRPFSLEFEEAKTEIISVINNATQKRGIPFYLLEELLSNISYQIKEAAQNERKNAEKRYQDELAEFEKARGEE